ncbi:hypothetical protein [Fibrobacter sp. UWEL]|uniref:hypothetical protein n=1 Tax=Fibrobacter sp. UWEL TaxID=1896209 RepID=UPI0009203007|nr:hypothetical protein [Fibrobacter sp. UWEL]SHL06504.1 hypothetical protein SAMN05720468_11286 [Fibrobacter sp. UWEL]
MKFTKKTIASGMVAMALVACSDNESTSTAPQETPQGQLSQENPQDSIPTVSDTVQAPPDTIILIRDSVYMPTPEELDSLREQYYESLLKEDFVSNLIAVDCFSEEMGLGPCLGQRDTLSTGKVLVNNFNGFDRFIGCEQGDSTLLYYSISISYSDIETKDMRIKKRLIGNDEHVEEAFQKDCNQEGGTYSLDEDGRDICSITPVDSTDDNLIYYNDPYWAKYGRAVLNTCKDLPVSIKPEVSEPDTSNANGSQDSTNWVKTGECKANALAKTVANSDASTERNATITKIGEGSYEIMIPDASDYCAVSTGVIRYLAGEDLTIQYDLTCERHEEYYHPTDTTDIATVLTLYQYDESCSTATLSKCRCYSDHYFQVNEELLKGAKYVHFMDKKYTIENPLER